MAALQPDLQLVVAENGRNCRLGLVARDDEHNFWGLTARHVMEGHETTRLKDRNGQTIGHYSAAENQFGFNPTEAVAHIVRFALERSAVAARRVNYGVTWPRYTIEDGTLLGASIVSIEAADKLIGSISEVDSLAVVEFGEGNSVLIRGAIIVALEDRALARPGQAGTLLLSELGEAVGLGIATQEAGDDVEVIASPLRPFLEKSGLRPWAPSGAHWTDLPQRARSFLNDVMADRGPDLGGPPRIARR